MEHFRRNILAANVMTGVTALLGGIEPAAGEIQSFSVTVQESQFGSGDASGDFSDSNSDPIGFALFNTLGGTLQLTQVTVAVTGIAADLSADVSGNCRDVSGGECGASAQNDSEFSVIIDLGGGIDVAASQPFSIGATAGCTFIDSEGCSYFDSQSLPATPVFSTTITNAATLALFTGLGSFDITPGVGLSGPWSASFESVNNIEPSSSFGVAASTTFSGQIEVTYQFTEVAASVPEPATLFLFGTGLAGLGLLRRNRSGVA